ncbi:MAG: antitoxin Xre-like helix-turn-helix domain-containing protein, partial [Melioribacteraceae bacterium]
MATSLVESKVRKRIGTVHVIKNLEDGISTETVKKISTYLNISVNELITYLRISLSTWHRRNKIGKMDFDSSDKILQVSQLIEYGENIFGSHDKIT